MISSPMAVRVEQTNAEDDGNQMAEIFRMTSSSYWGEECEKELKLSGLILLFAPFQEAKPPSQSIVLLSPLAPRDLTPPLLNRDVY